MYSNFLGTQPYWLRELVRELKSWELCLDRAEGSSLMEQHIFETPHPVERGKTITLPTLYFEGASGILIEFDRRCQNEEPQDQLIFNSYFGFMGFLGVISLAGIVINNAIVLIDRIQIEEAIPGNSRYKAIFDAAHARFRPILLTTFTTTLGMIPLYLGGGLMWEPMAVAIMAGLLFATVITLIFIPVMYKLLFRINVES